MKETRRGGQGALVRHGPALLAVVLLPLLFHVSFIIGDEEPAARNPLEILQGDLGLEDDAPRPAPDTEAVRPLLDAAKRTEKELGVLPQWCPAIFSGMPSYGSFIYAPAASHQLFNLVIRPVAEKRGLRYYAAMLLAGLTLYALGIQLGFSPLGAATGSLVFVLTPYMVGAIQAGHSTKLRALYHVPLLFLAVETVLRKPALRNGALLALSLALLGWTRHPQIAYYAVLLALFYAAGRLLWLRPAWCSGRGWARGAFLVAAAVALTGGMLLDPLASIREYIPYSVRGDPGVFAGAEDVSGGTPWDYATAWSFSPGELVSFLVPEWYGLEGITYWGKMPFTQSTHYFGVVALTLAFLGTMWNRGRGVWIWTGLALAVLVIGFGSHLPVLYRPFYLFLPFFNKFRVPSMIYALLPLLLAPLIGEALRHVEGGGILAPGHAKRKGKAKEGAARRRPGAWILPAAAVCGFLLLLWLVGGASLTESLKSGPAWFQRHEDSRYGVQVLQLLENARAELLYAGVRRSLFLLTLFFGVLEIRRRGWLSGVWASLILAVLAVGDVWVVGKAFQNLEPRSQLEQSYEPDEALRFLEGQEGPFRFLPLDDAGSNLHAALGLQSVMGYHPAKLRAYEDLIAARGLQSIHVLDMLQTRYLVADSGGEAAGYRLVHDGRRKVLERTLDLPRAWLVREVRLHADARSALESVAGAGFRPFETAEAVTVSGLTAGPRSTGSVRLRDWNAHTVDLEAAVEGDGEGLLVVSEMCYPPGWRARVDGREAPIHRVNHVLMAVDVPPGRHDVVFTVESGIRKTSVAVSRGATVLTVLLFAIPLAAGRLAPWRRSGTPPAAPRASGSAT
jgi:hypothetical protein